MIEIRELLDGEFNFDETPVDIINKILVVEINDTDIMSAMMSYLITIMSHFYHNYQQLLSLKFIKGSFYKLEEFAKNIRALDEILNSDIFTEYPYGEMIDCRKMDKNCQYAGVVIYTFNELREDILSYLIALTDPIVDTSIINMISDISKFERLYNYTFDTYKLFRDFIKSCEPLKEEKDEVI